MSGTVSPLMVTGEADGSAGQRYTVLVPELSTVPESDSEDSCSVFRVRDGRG